MICFKYFQLIIVAVPFLKQLELRGHDYLALHAVLHYTPLHACCGELSLSCFSAAPLHRLACLNEIINKIMFVCKMFVHPNIYTYINICHVYSNICSIHPIYHVATLWSNKLAMIHSVTHVLYMNNSLYRVNHALMMEKKNVFAPMNFGPELA
jgi:hypothetical protein